MPLEGVRSVPGLGLVVEIPARTSVTRASRAPILTASDSSGGRRCS